jgi:hypothetical protein
MKMEWILAGETEVLGGNLPPAPLCPSQIPLDVFSGGKPVANRMSYGVALE